MKKIEWKNSFIIKNLDNSFCWLVGFKFKWVVDVHHLCLDSLHWLLVWPETLQSKGEASGTTGSLVVRGFLILKIFLFETTLVLERIFWRITTRQFSYVKIRGFSNTKIGHYKFMQFISLEFVVKSEILIVNPLVFLTSSDFLMKKWLGGIGGSHIWNDGGFISRKK